MRRRRNDRGAVLLMVAILSAVFMLIAALAVDLGLQRVARRDMQALADVVSLDLARHLDATKTTLQLESDPAWDNALAESIARNSDTTGDAPAVTARLGTLDNDGAFVATGPGEVPTAVQVTAATKVSFSFASGSGGAARTAVATASTSGCFTLSPYVEGINSSEGFLLGALVNQALRGGVNTTLQEYKSLAQLEIRLPDLVETDLGVDSVDALLDLRNVSVRDLYQALAQVLSDGHSAEASLLQSMASTADPIHVIDMADLVAVDAADAVALASNVNVFDLVAGAAFLSNGDDILDAGGLNLDVFGLEDVATELTLADGPHRACSDKVAETAQVRLDITGKLATVAVLGLTGEDIPVDISIDLAHATGVIQSLDCRSGTPADPDTMNVSLQTDVARLELSAEVALERDAAPVATLTAGASSFSSDAFATAPLTLPPNDRVPKVVGEGSPIPGVTISNTDVTITDPAIDQAALLAAVTDTIVQPLVDAVNELVAGQLSDLLGLNVAGADLLGEPNPSCNTPALRG